MSECSPPWFPQPSVPQGVLGTAHPSLMSPAAEKVSSLGKDWHKFCLKCERCNKTLTPGGHAEVRAARVGAVLARCAGMGIQEQGWGIQEQISDAVWGMQAQENTLWLLRAQPWASHRVVLAPRVCPCGETWHAPGSSGSSRHWAGSFGHCTGFGEVCVPRACTALWLKTPGMGNAWIAMAARARCWCSLCLECDATATPQPLGV